MQVGLKKVRRLKHVPNFQRQAPTLASLICKSGKTRKTCKCALCTVDDTYCFHDIRLGPNTSVYHMKVIVVSTATGCDVTYCATTLQGLNKHASSRLEAVSDSRGVPRCTEKISQKSTLAHMCRSFDLSNPPYPYPMTSKDIRCHSDSHPS